VLGRQILEDAEHLIGSLQRAAGGTHADAVLADDRCRHRRAALVPVGPLPSLPRLNPLLEAPVVDQPPGCESWGRPGG
jgi:hypothetical protein